MGCTTPNEDRLRYRVEAMPGAMPGDQDKGDGIVTSEGGKICGG